MINSILKRFIGQSTSSPYSTSKETLPIRRYFEEFPSETPSKCEKHVTRESASPEKGLKENSEEFLWKITISVNWRRC